MLKKIIDFLKTDIWRFRLDHFPPLTAFGLKQLRIILLAFRGYREHTCQFRASALTFYTMLSIVPVLALIFGIAKGFGLEEMLEKQITERLQVIDSLNSDVNISEQLMVFVNQFLDNVSSTRGDIVAGIGVALLFMTILKVLGNIENSFNYIWGIQKPRTFTRKFSDYLSVIIVCPVLLAIAGSATVVISSKISTIIEGLAIGEYIKSLIMLGIRLLPYCSLWIVFTFIFIFMPNTKVKFRSGLIAGIAAGTLFQLAQWAYIKFQIGAAKYNAIYGSFAALPLFLAWLQLSWFIVLLGAEISFAHQNVETYEFEPDCHNASLSAKNKVSILITAIIVQNFQKGLKALSAAQISSKYDIPIRLVRESLNNLLDAEIVSEVRIEDEKDFGYQPAKDVENLKIYDVISAINQKGAPNLPLPDTELVNKINDTMANINEKLNMSSDNLKFKDIV